MNKLTKSDLEDIALIFEELVQRVPVMKREDKVDVAARLRAVSKHIAAIDTMVKDEIKKARKGKEGFVNGEVFKAKLSLVLVNRLDQKALKEGNPEVYDEYTKESEDQRITFEPR